MARITSTITSPTADAETIEAGALEKISGFLEAVGISPARLPVNSADAIHILREGGQYNFSAAVLAEFVGKGYVGRPAGGKWFAFDIYQWAAALEARRRWLPFSIHAGKQSHFERMQDLATAAGDEDQFFDDLRNHTVEDLCIRLAQCDNPQARWGLFVGLKQKLGQDFYK